MVSTSIWEGKALSSSAVFLIEFLFIISLAQQICTAAAKHSRICAPSSCGKISNISQPFRLKDDPKDCGDQRYELDCVNNVTVLHLNSAEYHVQAINYNNYTIRLVDPNIQAKDCSTIPRYFLSKELNFSYDLDLESGGGGSYEAVQRIAKLGSEPTLFYLFQDIIYLYCQNPVSDDASYVDTSSCIDRHVYAIVGDLDMPSWRPGCSGKVMSPYSGTALDADNVSYIDIHSKLVYGFELSWFAFACDSHCGSGSCYWNDPIGVVQCDPKSPYCYYINGKAHSCGILVRIFVYTKASLYGILRGIYSLISLRPAHLDDANAINRAIAAGRYGLPSYAAGRFLFGAALLITLLIYKWRRRHLSAYDNIENFLQDYDFMPIRYSYKEIKKMTRDFKDKLGQGGFGSVYKGKLRSGPYVAIKMLGESKTNGQEFISEVATIGRIHHVNVVRLIGFCVEGSKRALVYEFMPNGSLDKYIFLKDGRIPLTYEKIYEISLAVAHGIAYLHQGCDVQILHFDIKPHNILLDENLIPKISDFGLAKLYPVNDSIVTLTAARGTIGYMAPELFYKNIGGVSFKADVYSFGMLLMEMAGRRKNMNPNAEHSSQAYFPFWIYDQVSEEKDVEIEDATEEEKNLAKKMFIVALWCIQLKPRERPSMKKIVEMLEGEVETLEMPPKPSLYPEETIDPCSSDQTLSSGFTSYTSYLGGTATDLSFENKDSQQATVTLEDGVAGQKTAI